MAKDKVKEEPEVADVPKKKPKGKLFMIIGIVLVMVAVGGGAAWYFTKSDPKAAEGAVAEGEATEEGAAAHVEKEKEKEEDQGPPIYERLEDFTVNMQVDEDSSQDHYLQVGINLKIADEKTVVEVKARMPEIRNAVLLLLSSKTASELRTLEGKQKLSAEIKEQVNKIVKSKTAEKAVTGVLFISMVIQ